MTLIISHRRIPQLTTPSSITYTTIEYITSGDTQLITNTPRTATYGNYPRRPRETPESRLKARLALVRLWCWEARQEQFQDLLGPKSPETTERKLGFTRERKPRPVRQRFKKRVCGGANRYRVLVN